MCARSPATVYTLQLRRPPPVARPGQNGLARDGEVRMGRAGYPFPKPVLQKSPLMMKMNLKTIILKYKNKIFHLKLQTDEIV